MKYLAFGWTRRHRGCSAILLQKQLSILRWKVQWMTHNIKLQTKQQWRTVYHIIHCVKLLKLHLAIICDNFIPLAVENFFLSGMKGSFFAHLILCNYLNDPFVSSFTLNVSTHSCWSIWSNYYQSTTKKNLSFSHHKWHTLYWFIVIAKVLQGIISNSMNCFHRGNTFSVQGKQLFLSSKLPQVSESLGKLYAWTGPIDAPIILLITITYKRAVQLLYCVMQEYYLLAWCWRFFRLFTALYLC